MTIALDFLLWSLPLALAYHEAGSRSRKTRLRKALASLGLARFPLPGTLAHALLLLAALLLVSFVVGAAAEALGLNDTAPVEEAVRQALASPPTLAYVLLVRTMGEELFFRALLVPRAGVLASSAFFGLAHAGYGSLAQVAAAFLLGLLLALAYARTRNLYTVFLAHLGFNAATVAAVVEAGP